uniref:Protein kinase domain-containing protein n=1 Tax=Macrostomum lignano TaxID=282301 RepID=A0A1I8F8A8_9PLAT
MQTLTRGAVFGLQDLFKPDQPSLCVPGAAADTAAGEGQLEAYKQLLVRGAVENFGRPPGRPQGRLHGLPFVRPCGAGARPPRPRCFRRRRQQNRMSTSGNRPTGQRATVLGTPGQQIVAGQVRPGPAMSSWSRRPASVGWPGIAGSRGRRSSKRSESAAPAGSSGTADGAGRDRPKRRPEAADDRRRLARGRRARCPAASSSWPPMMTLMKKARRSGLGLPASGLTRCSGDPSSAKGGELLADSASSCRSPPAAGAGPWAVRAAGPAPIGGVGSTRRCRANQRSNGRYSASAFSTASPSLSPSAVAVDSPTEAALRQEVANFGLANPPFHSRAVLLGEPSARSRRPRQQASALSAERRESETHRIASSAAAAPRPVRTAANDRAIRRRGRQPRGSMSAGPGQRRPADRRVAAAAPSAASREASPAAGLSAPPMQRAARKTSGAAAARPSASAQDLVDEGVEQQRRFQQQTEALQGRLGRGAAGGSQAVVYSVTSGGMSRLSIIGSAEAHASSV